MCLLIVYAVIYELGGIQIEVKEHHYFWDANSESSEYGVLLVILKHIQWHFETRFRKAKQLCFEKCFNDFKLYLKNT